MKKIVIVEPHPDDFWLNMSVFALRASRSYVVRVVTVFSHGRGASNPLYTKALVNRAIQGEHVDLGYTNLEDATNVSTDRGVKKKLRDSVLSLSSEFEKINGRPLSALQSSISDAVGGCSCVYLPQGYKNPNHNLLANLDVHENQLYYREFPYFWSPSPVLPNADYRYPKFTLYDTVTMTKEELSWKWSLFQAAYKDQIGSMWFVRPYYKSLDTEVIFSRSGDYFSGYVEARRWLKTCW